MKVRLHAEAAAEVNEAFLYFEGERTGLGIEFVRAVDEAINRIVAGPQRWPCSEATRGVALPTSSSMASCTAFVRTRSKSWQLATFGASPTTGGNGDGPEGTPAPTHAYDTTSVTSR